MASYFTDPDGDALTFTAASSNAATASVSVSGSVVMVTAAARGIATITVTARDSGGLSAQLTFTVTVPNQAPVLADTVPAQTIFVGDTASVDMAAYFTDPDGDALTYSVASSDATAVSASVSGSVVSLTAITQGISTVTVTASDPDELSAEQHIAVTVPNRAPIALDTIPSRTLLAGSTLEFDLARYFTDPDGDSLTFTAASANVGVASVESIGSTLTITARAPGSTRVTVTVADPAGMAIQQLFAVTVPNREPVAVGSIPGRSVEPQQAVTVDVSPFFDDPDGEVLSYSAASSNRGVATAAVSGATVTLTGVAVGTASITVTATDPGGLTAQQRFSVTVRAANDAPEVVSTIPDLSLTVDEVRAWRGADHFRDPNGDPLTYAAGSSNAAVVLALVSGAEFGIGAVSVGSAVVTVTASDPGGLSAQFSFRVTVQPGTQTEVVISGVEPTVLVEGTEARITGSGFSATAAQNQVTVGGIAASVTAATTTRLTIMVPYADCLPPRREELRVAVGAQSDARTVGVTPASREALDSLQPGWSVSTRAGNGCVHLPASASGGEYLLGVVSTSQDPAQVAAVALTGTPGDATVLAAATATIAAGVVHQPKPVALAGWEPGQFASVRPMGLPRISVAAYDQELDPVRPDWERHSEIMKDGFELVRRLGPPSGDYSQTALSRSGAVAATDTFAFYAAGSSCTDRGVVRAVIRYVGNHAVWLEDVDNPSGGFSDADHAELDAFYSEHVAPTHDGYFGQLTDIDELGRFVILMTKEANRQDVRDKSFFGGWVWPADLLPPSQCPTSNGMEIFYGRVPDPDGVFGNPWTKQRTLDYYPSLLAHEITHLVQSGYMVVHRSAQYESWELEGGATLAEQLVAYRLFGHGSGQDLGWNAYNASDESRSWYWSWVGDMARFFGWNSDGDGRGRVSYAPEQCTWIGRPEEGNTGPCKAPFRAVYGVPSMVYRYAMDLWGGEYNGGERAMMRRLTQSRHAGWASLEDVSSQSIESILAGFYITLWGDLQGYDMRGMATWNLRDIFSQFRSDRHLQPYTSSSSQPRVTASVRGGSNLYLHWTPTGSLRPTAIKVTSANGGPVPGHISVWAWRIR